MTIYALIDQLDSNYKTRISELEAEVAQLRAERARTVERIRDRIQCCDQSPWDQGRRMGLRLALMDLGVDPDAQDDGKERAG